MYPLFTPIGLEEGLQDYNNTFLKANYEHTTFSDTPMSFRFREDAVVNIHLTHVKSTL